MREELKGIDLNNPAEVHNYEINNRIEVFMRHTEMRFVLCTWFGEFCACCSLTALPGPAWVLLNWICK